MLARLAVILMLALAGPAVAGEARDRLVVDTAWLAGNLERPDLVILHVGDEASYDAGHIPGARLVTLADVAAPPEQANALILQMPDAETLRRKLVALGVSDRSRIVVYPAVNIQSATRVVFTLDAAGLGERTVLLDGGLAAWKAEGRATTVEAPTITPGELSPLTLRPLVADADLVRRSLGAPGYAVVDSRTPEFYSGRKAGGPPGRPHKKGHIAGAKNVPFDTVTTADQRLAPEAEIRARFEAAGVKPGDTVITYCHVGQQASATLFAARSLGLKVLLYDGSFEEWSRLEGPTDLGDAIFAAP